MAFNINASNVRNINEATQSNQREDWRSDRFINFEIPTEDGGSIKLCAAGLKLSDPNHAELIQWLDQDPENNLKTLLKHITASYRDATKKKRGFSFIG